jgi:hypothetical protein
MNLPTATVPVLALRKLQFLAGPFMSIISSGCRALKWMNADVFFVLEDWFRVVPT